MDAATRELIHRFRNDDQAAFAELYDLLYHSVLFHTRNLLEQQQAEEVSADAFYKLWQNRLQFNHIGSIRKWLHVTATNGAINVLKQETGIQKKHHALAYLTGNAWEETLDRDMAEFELFARISREIENLAPQQRKVLQLFYFENKTIAQIAAEMQLAEITVKQTKARALELLKKKIPPRDLLIFMGMLSPLFQ